MSGSTYLLERAWVDGAVHDDVLVVVEDGVFTSVGPVRETGTCQGEDHLTRATFTG